jgi:hypothetical protein
MAIISNAVTIADAGAFSVSLGSMVHIKTLTASASATLSFVHGTADVVLDSTYPIYKFEFINIHPSAYAMLSFNFKYRYMVQIIMLQKQLQLHLLITQKMMLQQIIRLYRFRFSTRNRSSIFLEVFILDNDSSLSGEICYFSHHLQQLLLNILYQIHQRMDFSVRPYTNRWLCSWI